MRILLAALVLPGLAAQEGRPGPDLLQIVGGSADDARLIRAAFGWKPGQPLDDATLAQGVAAVKRIGRYSAVEGFRQGGMTVLKVQSLRPVAKILWPEGPPSKVQRAVVPSLRIGARMGDVRLEEWREDARARLREGGWPEADPAIERLEDGALLRVQLRAGPPAVIRTVVVEGNAGAYSKNKLMKIAGLREGRTLWSAVVARKAPQLLRERFLKDRRLEGRAAISWDAAQGRAVIFVDPGPKVRLRLKGASVGGFFSTERSLRDLLPEPRAAVFDLRLLEEGARRLRRHFRDQGYADAAIAVERRVTQGPSDRPAAVEYLHTADLGPRYKLGAVAFEGNLGIPESELRAATATQLRRLLGRAWVGPELLRDLEERVRNLYRLRGYPEVRVRTERIPRNGDRHDVKVNVREGARRVLTELQLELPPQPGLDTVRYSQALVYWLQDHPAAKRLKDGATIYPADRAHLEGISGRLEALPPSPGGGPRFRFLASSPVPFVRGDLAQVVSDLRQQLAAAGSERPKVSFEDDGQSGSLLIRVPAQPLDTFRRLVVRNLDRTRPEALLREYPREAGDPYNPTELDRALGRASDLGAFSRLDLSPLSEQPGQEEAGWQRGDLELKAQERSPWTFSSGFAYDRAQGYRFLEGVQRNNLGGMGRTADFSVRAGDSTLRSKALKELFPTGDFNRSLDSYTLGYTDPWFLPGSLDTLLRPRTQFRVEGAYLEEAQPAFFARRRRALAGLEWKITDRQTAQIGYRFERADLGANRDAAGNDLINSADLQAFARSPLRTVISAPRLQVSVDRRDKPNDPTSGAAFEGLLEFGLQSFGTSENASFIRLDLRHQWNWPVGFQAAAGVVMANLRLGIARPTANSVQELPLTERYFGGGPFSVRGVEPGFLGPVTYLPKLNPATNLPVPGSEQLTPLGGQAVATANLEYRFPLPFLGQTLWGEVFVDGGQVYERVESRASFPAWRITPGLGLILKLGFPIKLEYAADWKRILGKPRTDLERQTQLSTLLISAGFQY